MLQYSKHITQVMAACGTMHLKKSFVIQQTFRAPLINTFISMLDRTSGFNAAGAASESKDKKQ